MCRHGGKKTPTLFPPIYFFMKSWIDIWETDVFVVFCKGGHKQEGGFLWK